MMTPMFMNPQMGMPWMVPGQGAVAPIFAVLLALLGIAVLILWIWSLIHAFRHQKDWKLVAWIVALVGLKLFGAVLYWFIAYRGEQKKAQHKHTDHGHEKE